MSADSPDNPEVFNPADKSKVNIIYFSTARVSMLIECNKHPVLIAQLNEMQESSIKPDWADIIGEIAAYCNVLMDGMYSNDDLEVLYPQLKKRMTDTRLGCNAGIILTH